MLEVNTITTLHTTTVQRWHEQDITNPYEGFLHTVCCQHEYNYRLWHEEDIARSQDVSDADIARVKRAIDKLNQQRNDFIERLDEQLIELLARHHVMPQPSARPNSETPGSVIDRLSILSLRIYHMREQAARADATPEHRARAQAKLETCLAQHKDLSLALAQLLDDLFAGRKLLKVYRQFKMYNDPTMNPYLYQSAKKPAA